MSSTVGESASCLADQLLGTQLNRIRPRVRAAIHPSIQRFLDSKDLAFSLVDGLGSPLNIIFPDNIAETIAGFEKVYRERSLQGRIFYTSKPNKSLALRKRAALTSVGLDVSSEGELKNGLTTGFHPSRIEATGPKNLDYLSLGVQHGILFNVDNFVELQQLVQMAAVLPKREKIGVLVRLDGFVSSHKKFTAQDSAFGNRAEEVAGLIDFLLAHRETIDFRGFSFHFNAGDYIRRPLAIEKCLELTFACIERGLNPRGLNIGGGYRIRYAASQDEWNLWVEELKASVLGQRSSITWNESGLGFSSEKGVLKGAPNFMEHFHKDDGPGDLASVIDTHLPSFGNQSLANILSDSLMELYVEPGRALLDQCGITLARVNFIKQSLTNETLVMLDMNRTNLNATQLKLLTDPIVLHKGLASQPAENGVYYVGNLCLTHDMIQYHKTFPGFLPQAGDVVAFVNTAAYQMDFAETTVLQQRIADKVAVVEVDGRFCWFREELYNPLAQRMLK
jgi:diaminopimelate decarboxylase